MLKIARSLLLWTQIRRAYLMGDYASASKAASEYRRLGIIDEKFEALDATLDLLTNNSESAFLKFSNLAKKIKSSGHFPNSEYINLYCQFYMSLFRHNDTRPIVQAMQKAEATAYIRKVLPVPIGEAEMQKLYGSLVDTNDNSDDSDAELPRKKS